MSIVIDANPVPLEATPEGVLRVAGTRVTLDTIVAAFKQGDTPESIAEQYPTVSLEKVFSVITFYLRRRGEVDEYLAARKTYRDQVRRQSEQRWPQDGIRERLLQRRTPTS
jgi:uncharacterized protein (DUF433 family)